ncbi:rlmN [Symbiodinium necroappetens]|uniref:RlmN protein n=1 Tax=Symbiodinium necroappetens TaxID=1628268 RepID=A0A813BQL7_9DINO|nr:rlmN [Symbiodinium necroappetens]
MFDFDEIEEKLQQQAAASNPAHAPSIDGEWEDNDGTVVIIKNRRMRGPDGVEVEVTFPRPDAVVFTPSPGAPSFEGKLTASDRISWDDGASWVRRPLSAKAQTDQNGSGANAASNKAAGTPVHQTKTLGGEKENLAAKAAVPEKPNSKLHDSRGLCAAFFSPLWAEPSKSTARIPRVDDSAGTSKPSKPSSGYSSSRTPTTDKKAATNSSGEAGRDSAWHYERFEVTKPIVFVRESPGLNTAKVAQVTRGCVVSGRVQETGWLCLDQDSRASANVPEHAKGAYMLIDGRNHGLGILLESRGCQGSSKGSFASPLEFLALRNLQVRARPSLSSPSTGHVAEGSQVQGYPGAESWLELEGGGFLPIVDKTASANSESQDCLQLQGALQAAVPQTFAEAVVARWEPLPAAAATRVEYSLEWQDAQEPDRHGRVSFSRKCQAHVRSLPPSTTIQLRVVSRVFAPLPGGNPGAKGKEDPASRSWQDHRLVGRWLYGAKPSEYRIGRRSDGLLVFMGPHASGATVMGVLEPEGHWLQAELASASGDIVGHIRLFYDEEEDAVISNFKNIQNVDWGRDIAAKKGGDEEILTTVVGRWVQARTAAAITDQDEEDFCYDAFCNKRGKCQRCPCQIFVLSEHLMNQEMLCRRCGCAAIHHAKVGKFRFHEGQKGKDSEDASSTARPPQKTAMDEIPSRRWSLDDATAGEEIVEFIIRQLELAKNLYEVLGVAPSSSALEIRQAYRAISLRVHPDKINAQAQSEDEQSQSLSALAEDAFKLASSAYEVLNDEIERRSYDRQLYLDWVRPLLFARSFGPQLLLLQVLKAISLAMLAQKAMPQIRQSLDRTHNLEQGRGSLDFLRLKCAARHALRLWPIAGVFGLLGRQLAILLGKTSLARKDAEPLLASRTWEALREGRDPFQPEGSSKRLQRMLAELALTMEPVAAPHVESTESSDSTCKMLLRLEDDLSVECVLIRMAKHSSLCVSSQVGCKQACVFCATGKLGEVRNLTTHEILAQVWLAQRQARALDWPKVRNLVFMGMGEPTNNLDSVSRALELLTDNTSFHMSRWYITVSTVAPSPAQILSLSELPCKLAWSVHAATDVLRRKLVPSSKYPLADLRDAFLKCLLLRPERFRQLICEVVLLDEVNTDQGHAKALSELLSPFEREELLVNLIPYNDIHGLVARGAAMDVQTAQLRAPTLDTVRSFQRSLWQDTEGEDGRDPGRRVDEFFKNPTIGTFMNSPYYGEDGVFGSSGTIKENPAGGFSFELPGGGGIHIDNGNGYQRRRGLSFQATAWQDIRSELRVQKVQILDWMDLALAQCRICGRSLFFHRRKGAPQRQAQRQAAFELRRIQDRSRGGITIRPPTAPTDIEDNEPVPEKSTLDWLNLNALAPKAIQGAIDRIRHNTLASSGDAEVPKEMDGELLTSPRGKGTDQSAGSMGYARPARKSLSSALRARGGISRGVAGTESDPAEGPDADAPDVPEPSWPEVPLDEAEDTPVEAAAPVPEEAEEAVPEEPQPSESPEAAFAQPTADRTASAPLPVLHEEEEEESTIAAAMPVQVEQPDERAAPDALDGLAEAEELPNQEELPDRQEVPAELLD